MTNILCFGCSFTAGIDKRYSWPMKIAIDNSDMEVYNFGLGGSSPMVSGFLLDAYLKANDKPSFVFFQISFMNRLSGFGLGAFKVNGRVGHRYGEKFEFFNPMHWMFSTDENKLKKLESDHEANYGILYKSQPEGLKFIDERQPTNYYRWPVATTAIDNIIDFKWASLSNPKESWIKGYNKFHLEDMVETCYKFKINIAYVKSILVKHNIPHLIFTQTAKFRHDEDNEYRIVADFCKDLVDFEMYEVFDFSSYHKDNVHHLSDEGLDIQAELLFKKMVSKNDFR